MKKLKEIKSLLEHHKETITQKYHIKRIAIFGSVARNEETELSDVDILVELEQPIGLDFVLLGDELEELLGLKVDVVTPNAIKPKIMEQIKLDLVYV